MSKEIQADFDYFEQKYGDFDYKLNTSKNLNINNDEIKKWLKLIIKYGSKVFTNNFSITSKRLKDYKRLEEIYYNQVNYNNYIKELLRIYENIRNTIRVANGLKKLYNIV